MAESVALTLDDAAATSAAGAALARAVLALRPASLTIHLQGDLGAGKTTLVRGFLAALGHRGRVPSPTYTLIEPYEIAGYRVCHLDLYRLADAREIDDLDLGGQLGPGSLALIEWPERAAGRLPAADVSCLLELLAPGRSLSLTPGSRTGEALLRQLSSDA